MARYRLELGPVPLHHQVYLDLVAALDAGEWKPGDQLPTERDLAERYGCSLITVRRALGELVARAAPRAHPGSWHVRPAPAHRSRLRGPPVVHRGDAAPRDGARRPGSSRRGRSPPVSPSPRRWAWSRARRSCTWSGSAWPMANRCCWSRSTCRPSDSPACSRRTSKGAPCTICSRIATAPASPRPANSWSRSSCPPVKRASWVASEARRRCSSRASPRPRTGRPVEFGRTYVRGDRTRYFVERVVVRPRWITRGESEGDSTVADELRPKAPAVEVER